MVPLEVGARDRWQHAWGHARLCRPLLLADLQQLYVVALQRHLWPEGLTLLSRFGMRARLKIAGLEAA